MVESRPVRRWLIGCCVLLALAPALIAQSPKPTDSGQWWQFRGDRRLTGRARVKGDIQGAPSVLWSQDLSARTTWMALTPRPGAAPASVSLPTANVGTVVPYQTFLH